MTKNDSGPANNACCCLSKGCADIPAVTAALTLKDRLGAFKVRWGIGRMDYKVAPGLYALGQPDENAPVLVSANYKLTFDTLRKNLAGLDCWLLILDTKGVNVWCAAGKGTFGTLEVQKRVKTTGLISIVNHRQLIMPQLGASGVDAQLVKRLTGFTVIYGPVRAGDIKQFLAQGHKATKNMRQVNFTVWDRLVLTPVEFMGAAKTSLMVFGALFIVNLFAARPFGPADFFAYVGAVCAGAIIAPLLLPLIPGRAFAFKGWLAGAVCTALIVWAQGWFNSSFLLLGIGYMLALPAYSAFLTMNFTGSSTYTSFSGVIKEMKISLPFIILSLVLGTSMVLIKTFAG